MIPKEISARLRKGDTMCKRFDDWSQEIKNFCDKNGYSIEKAKSLSQCWGKDDLFLQYFDPDSESVRKGLGLLDETPMPLVLYIKRLLMADFYLSRQNTLKNILRSFL